MAESQSRDGESLDEGECISVGRLKNRLLEVKMRKLWNTRVSDV